MGVMECGAPGCDNILCTNIVNSRYESYYICNNCIPRLISHLAITEISEDAIRTFFEGETDPSSDRISQATKFLADKTQVYDGENWKYPWERDDDETI